MDYTWAVAAPTGTTMGKYETPTYQHPLRIIDGIDRLVAGIKQLINGIHRLINCITRLIDGSTRRINGWGARGPGPPPGGVGGCVGVGRRPPAIN